MGCGYRILWPLSEVVPLWAILAFHWAANCVLTAKEMESKTCGLDKGHNAKEELQYPSCRLESNSRAFGTLDSYFRNLSCWSTKDPRRGKISIEAQL